MDAHENKLLLERVFAEMAAGRPGALTAVMADDFRWVFPGEWSWAGVWEPKEAVVRGLLRPLMAQFDGYRSVAHDIVAEGDQVVVRARADATTKRGERYDQHYCFVFRVRDGLLYEVVEYCDTALVERVLERPAGPDQQS